MKETKRGEREGARVVQQRALASASAADPLRDSPRMVTQRARIDAAFGAVAQKADALEDEEPLQARMEDAAPKNETGMPNQLKAGIEALSGMDMSDVRVHRNSDKPAQLNALAYAQGNDIHLGPGQEQHLPHEAWHVVQQAQGRVRPTMQMAGAAVNDDVGLERDADVMGARAAAGVGPLGVQRTRRNLAPAPSSMQRAVAQRAIGMEFECSNFSVTSSRKAEKGDQICGGYMWKLVYETTAAGPAVAEFVVEPAANTALQLLQAVKGMVGKAKNLTQNGTTTIGDFTITAAGPADAAIQITVGTPLEHIPDVMREFRTEKEKFALKSFEKMQQQRILAPGDVEFQMLPAETQGFVLLLMDYLRRGWVPVEFRPTVVNVDSGARFIKAIFEMMARNDFTSIFNTLSDGEKDRLSEDGPHGKVMKDEWTRFIVDNALKPADVRGTDDLLDEKMINEKIAGWDTIGAGPKRRKWLTDMPHLDHLTAKGYMGIGKMGGQMDHRKSDGKGAPLLEVRAPYASSKTVDQWFDLAEQAWDAYARAMGGEDIVQGR